MSWGYYELPIALDGSGVGSGTILLQGILAALRVERSSGSPVVTVSDSVDTVLNGVTVATNRTYHPHTEAENNAGTGQAQYIPFQFNGIVTVTVTGGAASGTVTLKFKVI